MGDQLSRREVALRVGLHCVPTAHETAGTLETGTLRLSFSDFNTPGEVERFLAVIARLI